MNIFDWIIIAILLFFLLKSIIRGATREIFSLLALVLSSFFSCRYYSVLVLFLQPYFKNYINNEWGPNIAAFIAIFVITYFIVSIIGWLISRLIETIRLSFLDKIAGIFVGAAKACILICCVIIILIILPQGNRYIKDSLLSPYAFPIIKFIAKKLPEPVKSIIEEKTKEFDKKTNIKLESF